MRYVIKCQDKYIMHAFIVPSDESFKAQIAAHFIEDRNLALRFDRKDMAIALAKSFNAEVEEIEK